MDSSSHSQRAIDHPMTIYLQHMEWKNPSAPTGHRHTQHDANTLLLDANMVQEEDDDDDVGLAALVWTMNMIHWRHCSHTASLDDDAAAHVRDSTGVAAL